MSDSHDQIASPPDGSTAADDQPKFPAAMAMVLTGGGARGAYQVGVLRGLGKLFPRLNVPIITGVSAGAINAVFLAAHPGSLEEATCELADIWCGIEVGDVFNVKLPWLTGNFLRWTAGLLFGRHRPSEIKGFLETEPLTHLLRGILEAPGGRIDGIEDNLTSGKLRAIALSTVNYGTGQTVHWVQGTDIPDWRAPNRLSRQVDLRVEHVMASSALPLIFPAVRLADGWYGDGGIRLSAPLSPALRLGARRLIAVSTRYARSQAEADTPTTVSYPSPATIGGNLMNSIFLDVLDQDARRLERLNRVLSRLPESEREGMRPVDLLLLRPSEDLGRLAAQFEAKLPSGFRYFTRSFASGDDKSPDFLSLLMFQPDYIRRLISIGERDVASRRDEIRQLIDRSEEKPDA